MEHLDRDEEDEEGEASANARNKAINSLLRGSKPLNHNHNDHTAAVETDEEESEEEDAPVVRILKFVGVRIASRIFLLTYLHSSEFCIETI